MSQEYQSRRPTSSLYTQVDISPANQSSQQQPATGEDGEQMELLKDILASVDRNNELLEELLGVMTSQQKQRGQELQQWKQANPSLAGNCRHAAESLSQVQVEFLHKMTDEINDTVEDMMDGEFVLNEFVDRFGPRLAHLNGVIQVLAQLGSIPQSHGFAALAVVGVGQFCLRYFYLARVLSRTGTGIQRGPLRRQSDARPRWGDAQRRYALLYVSDRMSRSAL